MFTLAYVFTMVLLPKNSKSILPLWRLYENIEFLGLEAYVLCNLRPG